MARPTLNDDERALRRAQLLTVAHALFRQTQTLPSVSAIVTAAGVAKGTFYLSFGSKEEVFVALLEDSFGALIGAVVPAIAALPADAQAAAEQFSARFADAVAATPDLLPLAGMTNSVLEKNLPLPTMLAFKQGLVAGLEAAALALSHSALRLDQAEGVALLLRTWSMTLGLWQALDFPIALRSHLKQAPLNVFDRDFSVELRQAVYALWKGTLSQPARR
ncbi:TetR family transcriptional regulator [Ideonella sp.]|uniref:TetR family transcriptional regulator n=1 Tax=Ideonella sp. TaxID=1929293 RepID=UPI003BB6D08D